VICASLVADHSTIAEFRCRHEAAAAELFSSVLSLCSKAGLVTVGVIAIDGTKVAANASRDVNASYERVVSEILKEAEETDRREDEIHGEARRDELPEQLRTREGRRAAFGEAKRKLGAEPEARGDGEQAFDDEPIVAFDLDRERLITASRVGAAGAKRRLEDEHSVELQSNAAYEAYRARGVMKDGRRFGRPADPHTPPPRPAGTTNITDHDSRIMRTQGQPPKQGYNPQAAVNENQIIIAAEITVDSPDFGHLEPMVEATTRELEKAGVTALPETVVADPGYRHKQQMENVVRRGIQVLIPPDSGLRKGTRPGWNKGLYAFMRRVLATERGQAIYRRRMTTVEPVFGQMKFNRRFDREDDPQCTRSGA
jgi:Transposase DDE domain